MKKPRTRFKVVGLEEVFKTAVEVDGAWILDETMQRNQEKAQLRRCRERSSRPAGYNCREASQRAKSNRNPLH